MSFLFGFLVFILFVVLGGLIYVIRNTSFWRSIEPPANLTNLIRVKQIGAAFDYYFMTAWIAFFGILLASFLLRNTHKLVKRNGELRFGISTLVNFQKLAAPLIIQAPIVVLPRAIDPERMAKIYLENEKTLKLPILLSGVSFLLTRRTPLPCNPPLFSKLPKKSREDTPRNFLGDDHLGGRDLRGPGSPNSGRILRGVLPPIRTSRISTRGKGIVEKDYLDPRDENSSRFCSRPRKHGSN